MRQKRPKAQKRDWSDLESSSNGARQVRNWNDLTTRILLLESDTQSQVRICWARQFQCRRRKRA
jgi:hypothetical protein